MPDLAAAVVLIAYGIVLALLFPYGLNFFRLTWIALRERDRRPATVPVTEWPSVTVQLPVYNERYVVDRLIDAVAGLEYPLPIEIQVLDDSTDETVAIVARSVERWRGRGLRIVHLHRADRAGYKAGALAEGLPSAGGQLVAMFDADFIPSPDFLRRLVPILVADPGLAFVQARWDHTDAGVSALARVQALSIDGHFAVEQQARWSGGDWFNFNGTAGIWRRAAIEDAGGWRGTTLTEDLDLSYRAFLRGWRAAFAVDVAVPSELPPGINGYRRQQSRWARGSLECAVLHVPAVLRAPISRWRRLWAVLHLTGYGIHLLLLALSLLYPLMLGVVEVHPGAVDTLGLLGIFAVPALAPTILFLAGQSILGRPRVGALPAVVLLSLIGVGMMANTGRAALEAAVGVRGRFERTPKYGAATTRGDWRRLGYQVRGNATVLAEGVLAALNAGTALRAISGGFWAVAFFAGLFAAGLALVAGLTVAEAVRGAWVRRVGDAVRRAGDEAPTAVAYPAPVVVANDVPRRPRRVA